MIALLSTVFFNLFCVLNQCEFQFTPPFLVGNSYDNPLQPRTRLLAFDTHRQGRNFRDEEPVVYTKLGPVKGFKMKISDSRFAFAYTGVPFGETTGGENRFRAPVPKKPWAPMLLDATFPSPMCLQALPFAVGVDNLDKIRGQEDCLYLDIYTPQRNGGELLPVFIYLPGGAYWFGDSQTYGPNYLLREDVIFIPINVRVEIFGFLSTGDEHAPGNWHLKDIALAIEFVYQNIEAFGGDPNKIIIGGMSSGAMMAHLMLFTNFKARNYLKGIVALSGTALVEVSLDVHGRVQELSDATAQIANCPTSKEIDGSRRMVECFRKLPGKTLIKFFSRLLMPPALFYPTLEPPGPSAFISEPPEVQYRKGIVPPIPLIVTRAEKELELLLLPFRLMMPSIRPVYFRLMPIVHHFTFRTTLSKVNSSVSQASFKKVHQFYLGKSTAPNFLGPDYSKFCTMLDDSLFFAPLWKSIEYHHKIAPTYTYIQKTNTLAALPPLSLAQSSFSRIGPGHAAELALLFNMTRLTPPLTPGSDFDNVSRRLINMIVNFAKHGTPLYRDKEGKLLNLWKPVEDIRNPIALEVGLVKDIKMIVDPVAASGRLRIWDEVLF